MKQYTLNIALFAKLYKMFANVYYIPICQTYCSPNIPHTYVVCHVDQHCFVGSFTEPHKPTTFHMINTVTLALTDILQASKATHSNKSSLGNFQH